MCKNLFFFCIFFIVLQSCANLKVIERSNPEKPKWIYGIEKGYLTGEGKGKDYNEAKTIALHMVKEKIVSAIAQNISIEQNIKVNETRYKRAIEFIEEFTSKTTSKTGNLNYLQGISLSKASDFYWEKHRENKVEEIVYFIKYPFTESDINGLIEEWKKQEYILTQRLDSLRMNNHHDFETVEEIIEEIEELQYLSGFFVDQRKASADLSIKNLESKLNSIKLTPVYDTLGYYSYYLTLDSKAIKTIQSPSIVSNCADIKKVITKDNFGEIEYEYDNCKVEEDNSLNISYDFEEWKLDYKTLFDVSIKKISITNNNDISFSSIDKKFFSNSHFIKCYFTVTSQSPVSFTIDKIELIPEICKRNCRYGDNYKSFPVIILDNINKDFTGKGLHSFEVNTVVPRTLSNHWASRKGVETKISGRIYYSSSITGEKKIYEFSDLKYYTNW